MLHLYLYTLYSIIFDNLHGVPLRCLYNHLSCKSLQTLSTIRYCIAKRVSHTRYIISRYKQKKNFCIERLAGLDKRYNEKYLQKIEKISRPHPRCRLGVLCKNYSLLASPNGSHNCCIREFFEYRDFYSGLDTSDLDLNFHNSLDTRMSLANSSYFLRQSARNRKMVDSA